MIGKWALLDIETSGVDPAQDKVIDLGFVLFEDDKRLKDLSFRVKYDQALEPLIIALTGLCIPHLEEVGKSWEEIKEELEILQGAVVIAHNSSFEESFLKLLFDNLGIQTQKTDQGNYFHDSLDIFPFLLPYFPRLGLESINQIFQLWGKEQHQGLPDSTDLADALLFAHAQTPVEIRKEISNLQHLNSWWRKWILYPFKNALTKIPTQISFKAPLAITEWKEKNLLEYSKTYSEEQQKWLCLKLIQMMGRNISGILSLVQSSSYDLNIIFDVAKNFLNNFPSRKVVLCSNYFSPDEHLWFDQNLGAISVESLSCEIFNQHALEFSIILENQDQAWSQELMKFYHHKVPSYGAASRVPDLWCRREPVVDVLWKCCRYLARKKLKVLLRQNDLKNVVILQPTDLDLLSGETEVLTLFWQAKQLEWSTEFHVQKIKFHDYENSLIVCDILEKLDAENLPTVNAAKKLFEEFNQVINNYIMAQQGSDQKRIFWDVDFSELSRQYLSNWKVQVQNFLARRNNLKVYQSILVDALWSQIDELILQMQNACSNHSYGLSWRANSDKKVWELWNWNVSKLSYAGAKLFIDYEFDDDSKEYWTEIFGLNQVEKSKRFDKVQINEDLLQQKKFEIVIWEELQNSRLVQQIKDLSTRGRILFCSQDLALSSNVFSTLIKDKDTSVATWSEVMRGHLDPAPQIVFCWEKDFRMSPIAKNLWLNFDYVVIDRVPDLAWFAWAQAIWKVRSKVFSTSTFEAYWCRRAGLLREKYWPLVRLICAKEVFIFDSRKNKWKGDSWKILKSHISL